MGLSGRKTKQRIPNDPRNLSWANDATKFGAAYLSKLGWDPSRGLGVSGEGRTSALSVTQKLDMLGIGADHKNSAEGLAWKQNKDFENLLKRLNAANGNAGDELEERMKVDGFVRPTSPLAAADDVATPEEMQGVQKIVDKGGEEKRSKKKRKKDAEEDEGEKKKKRKKSKSSDDRSEAEGDSKTNKRKKKTQEVEDVTPSPLETETSTSSSIPSAAPTVSSRHPRALFRARHMASKNLASKSASAIAEILGISPADSGSTTPVYPSTPFEPTSTSSSSGPSGSITPAEEVKLQELTVSTKSVMDYFKEKLAAKSNASISLPSTPPAIGDADNYDERPRFGLGASKLRTEVTLEIGVEERRGLGGIGSGMRSSFAAMFTSATTSIPASEPQNQTGGVQADGEEQMKKRSKTKGKSKERAQHEDDEVDAVEELGESAEVDEKADRKRRKEEKRRRKELEAQGRLDAQAEVGDVGSDLGGKEERKRKKEKKKSKGE